MSETNPPPVTNPPPDPAPPVPPAPAPPAPNPPAPDAPAWLQTVLDAVGSIPEKVASAVREQTPAPPAPPRKTTEERREAGREILDAAGKPAGKPPADATPRKRTFAERWYGI